MQPLLQYYSFSLFLGSITSILSATLVIFYGRKREHFLWFLVNLSMVTWATGLYLMINSTIESQAYIYAKILHAGGILLAITFFLFCTLVTNSFKKYFSILIGSVIACLVLFVSLFSKNLISEVRPIYIFNYMSVGGNLYLFYTFYFFILTVLAECILFKAYFSSSNILDNSIKYTEIGRISIRLEKNNSAYLLTISDYGVRNLPTISPRLLRKLTDSGNIGEANIIGNGLGIYSAKLLIEANNGKLWIDTGEKGETIFHIELPN